MQFLSCCVSHSVNTTDAVAPNSFPNHASLNPNQAVDNCRQGINLANDVLGIPKLLTPEDLANPRIDEQSVVTYISYFRNADLEGILARPMSTCSFCWTTLLIHQRFR